MEQERNQITGTDASVGVETLVMQILPEVVNIICGKIKDFFFFDDIKQEIILSFLELKINTPDKGLAFKFGWQAVEKFRKRYEINFYTLTKNYTDEFNIDEVISKLNKIGTVLKDRRDDFYREDIITKVWGLRASGLTFKEIGTELNINEDTAENYFKRSIHNQSIPIDTKYRALKQTRRRSIGKDRALAIIDELKGSNNTMAKIAETQNVKVSTVSRINSGLAWNFLSDNYPIRNSARQNAAQHIATNGM